MSNTITAYFKGRVGVAESVYQNDYGIVMNFDSIDLPAHFDCYFSILNQEEAIPGVGADGMVAIPNSVLANPGAVTIHIPIHTGANDSEVEYVVYFKVIGRARPIDDGTPAQMTAIEQALALLQNPITNIEQIVNEALSFTGDTFDEMQAALDEDQAAFKEEIRSDISDVEADFASLNAQYQTAVSALTVDSEVQNIRNGADGVTYSSAGDAVRTQFTQLKSDCTNVSGEVFGVGDSLQIYATSNSWKLVPAGGCEEDSLYQMLKYQVVAGDILYLKLSKDGDSVYQFQSSASVPFGTNPNVIGSPVTVATDKAVKVPSGATYLIVSKYNTNNTNVVAYAESYVKDNADGISRLKTNDANNANFYYGLSFADLGYEFKNYAIDSTSEITPNSERLTTVEKIDSRGLSDVKIIIPTGYRAYISVYNSVNDIAPKFNVGWLPQGSYLYSMMFPYFRIMLAKTSGTISPVDANNFDIELTKEITDYAEKEMSLMLEKYISKDIIHYSFGTLESDSASATSYFPYQSGDITTNNVLISPIFRCVEGDSIEIVSTAESTRPLLEVFGADGMLRSYVNGIDTLTPKKVKYTFVSGDKYFRITTRRVQLRYLYIKYHSKYNNSRLVPDYAETECASVLSQIQNKMLLGNPIVFGFNTDQHTSYYYKEMNVIYGLQTLKMLANEVPFDFVCLGGDAPSYRSNQVVDILNDVNYVNNQLVGSACPVIPLVGNHDAVDNSTDVTNAELYNVTFKRAVTEKLFDYCEAIGCNAYIDSKMHSVRYIFVDSIPRAGYTLNDVNAFLSQALATLPTEYNALVISHRKLNVNLSTALGADGIDCGAILESYASKIIACINGHSHRDGSEVLNGILYIGTTTAGLDSLDSSDTRLNTLGSADETAYDVFVIDQTNTKIYAIRYGYGSNREWTYSL